MNDTKIKPIVFATHNANKLAEIREITGGEVEVLGLTDIGCHDEIDETGNTLEENALIKARQVKERYGYDCFADDTGLEVDALNGMPGVYSARYAGPSCDPEANMQKMLSVLQGIDNRAAQFRTVIALVANGEERLFEGIIRGRITREKQGSNGFGYDPIFVPEGYDLTFAEMEASVKNRVSHRAIAMAKLIEFLLMRKNRYL
ncbi:MAG: non-canonical purine NTP diphosphatase [Fermentimonas sp.]|jgi:XTP/dITP diphosphohydrolase